MKKSLFYLLACVSVMLFTVSCNKDEFDFQGSLGNPVTSVEIKNGNVICTVDEGEIATIMYYNFVDGKLNNIKSDVHYKNKTLANAAYDVWKMISETEDNEFKSVEKDGKVLKIEYKLNSYEFMAAEDLTAEELAERLRMTSEYKYEF